MQVSEVLALGVQDSSGGYGFQGCCVWGCKTPPGSAGLLWGLWVSEKLRLGGAGPPLAVPGPLLGCRSLRCWFWGCKTLPGGLGPLLGCRSLSCWLWGCGTPLEGPGPLLGVQFSGVLGGRGPLLGVPISGVLSLGMQNPSWGTRSPSWGAGFPRHAHGKMLGRARVPTGVPQDQEAGVRRVPPSHRSRPKLSGEKSRLRPNRGSGTAVG